MRGWGAVEVGGRAGGTRRTAGSGRGPSDGDGNGRRPETEGRPGRSVDAMTGCGPGDGCSGEAGGRAARSNPTCPWGAEVTDEPEAEPKDGMVASRLGLRHCGRSARRDPGPCAETSAVASELAATPSRTPASPLLPPARPSDLRRTRPSAEAATPSAAAPARGDQGISSPPAPGSQAKPGRLRHRIPAAWSCPPRLPVAAREPGTASAARAPNESANVFSHRRPRTRHRISGPRLERVRRVRSRRFHVNPSRLRPLASTNPASCPIPRQSAAVGSYASFGGVSWPVGALAEPFNRPAAPTLPIRLREPASVSVPDRPADGSMGRRAWTLRVEGSGRGDGAARQDRRRYPGPPSAT